MARFLDPLELRLISTTSRFVVLDKRLRYEADDGRHFRIPAGFRTDLASVPLWLRWMAPPWQQSARAGVLHDCGYRWFEVWGVPKAEMDGLFQQALRADGTGRFRARSMARAVRWFGGSAWTLWRDMPEEQKGPRPLPVMWAP